VSNEYQRDSYQDRGRGGGGGGGGRGPRGGHGGGHGGHGGYGGHGGHGGERRGIPLSELDPITTEASRKVIGASIDVHRTLGPGFDRSAYFGALRSELDALGVKYHVDHQFPVIYKDKKVGEIGSDLFVENLFLVKVSATPGPIGTPERMSLRAQLKAANLELGLIINFAERRLKDGLVRVVNIDKIRAERGIGFEDEDGGHAQGGSDTGMHDFDENT
jgi:GxxExxY protein